MHDELKQAARVHYSFLPENYEDEWLDVATCLTPKLVLGGDYCSLIPLGGQRYAACICDHTGFQSYSRTLRANQYINR